MDSYFEITKARCVSKFLTTYGMQVTTLFVIALLLLYLSNSRRPQLAHLARWFIWPTLLQGFLSSLEVVLDLGGFAGRPAYVARLFLGLQEGLAFFFLTAEIFRYRKAFPKPDPRDKKKIGAPEGG